MEDMKMSDTKKFKDWYKARCGHGLPVNLGMKAVTELEKENAELREALQRALNIKQLWLPCGSFGDNPPENYQEIEALHLMAKDFENLLNK